MSQRLARRQDYCRSGVVSPAHVEPTDVAADVASGLVVRVIDGEPAETGFIRRKVQGFRAGLGESLR